MSRKWSNEFYGGEDRQLIVIAAPSIKDSKYEKFFEDLIDFDVNFAKEVMGKDNIIILADEETIPSLLGKVPDDVILKCCVESIWMRDFTTVIPSIMVAFNYGSGTEKETQRVFQYSMKRFGVRFEYLQHLNIDGGNVVDNPSATRVIMTYKALQRNIHNFSSQDEIIRLLKRSMGDPEIAFIPSESEVTGHSDGQCLFVEDDEILVNDYKKEGEEGIYEAGLYDGIITCLRKAFGGEDKVKITRLPTNFGKKTFSGIYANSIVTSNYIYVPKFGNLEFDQKALRTIQSRTRSRKCVQIDCSKVGKLGGNCRCLSWQVTGENAMKLIRAARRPIRLRKKKKKEKV